MSIRRPERNPHDGGFSITESLVALFVFALAGVALVQMQSQSIRTLTRVEVRSLAGIVAENQLIEAMASVDTPALGVQEGDAELGGRRWRWRLDVMPTSDPATFRIEALAFAADSVEPSASTTAFRTAGAAR